jgi:hypothetical protein
MPEKDNQNSIARPGQPGRIARTEQPRKDFQDGIARKNNQDSQDITATAKT